jgi:hydrogenase nickel incorporation protein HypA/HybF
MTAVSAWAKRRWRCSVHELSIALSILEEAEEEIQRQGGVARVGAVYLRVGALSGIVKQSLISAYELACERTAFEGSRLVIEEIPIVVFCTKCQAERGVHSFQEFSCVECDTPASEILHGRELQLAALELVE